MLERDVNDNRKIGNCGAQHILSGVPRDSVTILTHCNTGSLATAGYGTALGESGAARDRKPAGGGGVVRSCINCAMCVQAWCGASTLWAG